MSKTEEVELAMIREGGKGRKEEKEVRKMRIRENGEENDGRSNNDRIQEEKRGN